MRIFYFWLQQKYYKESEYGSTSLGLEYVAFNLNSQWVCNEFNHTFRINHLKNFKPRDYQRLVVLSNDTTSLNNIWFFLTFTSISYPHTSWEMVKPPWKSGFLLECSCYNLSEIKTEIMRILVEYLKSLRNNSNAIKVHVNVRYLNKNVKTAFNYYIPNFKNLKISFHDQIRNCSHGHNSKEINI